jgi:hypothetical protein
LQQIAKILNVPPGFFFDGAPELHGQALEPAHAEFAEDDEGTAYIVDFLATAEGVRLNKAFARIHNPKIRKRIIDLVASLSDGDEAEPAESHES